jgi:cysteine desulfurase
MSFVSSPNKKLVTYLDANGTTLMSEKTIGVINRWFNRGNPSSIYSSASESQKLMNSFRSFIAKECEIDQNEWEILFTSGASESNSHILTSAARSYAMKTGNMPHIISTAIEHKSIIKCCELLERDQLATLTIVKPMINGLIDPESIAREIRSNTCIITCMSANNETGAINNIQRIGELAHAQNIPFHTDAVQIFGKSIIKPIIHNVDALSISMHKINGPLGCGLLIISKLLVEGYELSPHICGTQNSGLRGGTENLPAIAGSFAAFKFNRLGRK